MNDSVIVDTGPIVAYLNRAEPPHAWVVEQFKRLRPPLLTCEAVLVEAMFLLEDDIGDGTPVLEMVESKVLQVAVSVEDEAATLKQLMRRFRNVPMSLADACLVRLSETRDRPLVFTLDSDFQIYRRHGRLVIPTLMPPEK